MGQRQPPRADVDAVFPASSPYSGFVLRIVRPKDARGEDVLDRGWDILYEKLDGSIGYNCWADDWDEVLLFFATEPLYRDVPAWVTIGQFKDAIFPPDSGPATAG
jgi:hypothetical protein